ncbi:MAG TPA: peptide ABC transporter substrate-binding protein [Nitrospiria bacterium]|nr:peptide ABC transporter substrate-binding protein [Nitrospiria bacterium]
MRGLARRLGWLIVLGLWVAGASGVSTESHRAAVLRLAMSSEPPTLDWSLATDNVSITVIGNLMEGLTAFDESLRPQPAVASRWDVSPDGTTYTFHLRHDVYWTDGRRVTARDFEFSWKRLLNPRTGAEYAYFLYDVLNAYAYNTGRVTDPGLVGVTALDDSTLRVQLTKPIVYFPSITTFVVTFPQRQDLIERYGARWTDPGRLVTDGPFVLAEWRHEYKVVLRANPHYAWGKPAIDEVRMYVVNDPSTALTLYDTGDLDLARLPPEAIPFYEGSTEFARVPILRGYYYGFNVTAAPFDDPLVRQAFALAIDKSEFPRILKGGEVPTNSWIPVGMFGYNPGIGLAYDPEAARAKLAAAGYPRGRGFPEVTAAYNTDPVNTLIAENLQAQWKRTLGVSVALDNQEWKVYLKRLQTKTPPLYRLGWGADYPDPDNFMALFTSHSGNNYTHWADARYDELIGQAASMPDPVRRRQLYDEAQRILTEEAVPIIPLFVATQNYLVKPYVRGLRLDAMELLQLKGVSIR